MRERIRRRGPRKPQQPPQTPVTGNDAIHDHTHEPDASVDGYLGAAGDDDLHWTPESAAHDLSDPTIEEIDFQYPANDWAYQSAIPSSASVGKHGSEDVTASSADMTLYRQPSTITLSPMEPLLWNYYVNVFSRSYPTRADANNPFLSALIPIAFQYDPVRETLLALAALQAKHTCQGSITREIHRLRKSALTTGRKIMDQAIGADSPSTPRPAPENVQFGFPGAMLLLSREEKTVLVTIAVLMILFGKLSGADYESIRPFMDFAREYFVFEEMSAPYSDVTTQTPLYKFLRRLVSYNELLSLLATRKSAASGVQEPLEGITPTEPLSGSQQAFLNLLARISHSVGDVSPAEFEQWDGSLDFIPSYSDSIGPIPPLMDPLFEMATFGGALDEDAAAREIYRATGQAYFYQQLRDAWANLQCSTAAFSPPVFAQRQIDLSIAQTIDTLKTLGNETRYNTALLLPLGIIGPELKNMSHRAFVLAKLDYLYQTFHFDHYNVFAKDLIQAWARLDEWEQHPGSSPRWRMSLPARLIG